MDRSYLFYQAGYAEQGMVASRRFETYVRNCAQCSEDFRTEFRKGSVCGICKER